MAIWASPSLRLHLLSWLASLSIVWFNFQDFSLILVTFSFLLSVLHYVMDFSIKYQYLDEMSHELQQILTPVMLSEQIISNIFLYDKRMKFFNKSQNDRLNRKLSWIRILLQSLLFYFLSSIFNLPKLPLHILQSV